MEESCQSVRYVPFPAQHYSLLQRGHTVLLQTSRFDAQNYRSYLFNESVATLSTTEPRLIPALFCDVEEALRNGRFVAGFVSYECGEHFQELGRNASTSNGLPLVWLGVYAAPYVFNHMTGAFEGEAPADLAAEINPSCDISHEHLALDQKCFAEQVSRIKEYIRAGDIYQVNFTQKLQFEFGTPPLAMFAELSERQRVSYAAFLNLRDRQILSFSPELFFRIQNGRIFTRPMKGTAPRGRYSAEDAAIAEWLRNDTKNRSENVMIVDLLRNDLGRVCEFGSINVDELFAVEKYETLFQMTSAVSGALKPDVSHYDIFRSLFPCGSVTGAPKVRTMEIIRELEQEPRGLYTGAIGFFSPSREAVFNVAIRTIVLNGSCGEMGVGSGIVIDSSADSEYRECVLKTDFLTRRQPPFQLIETMLWDSGYSLLRLHLERLQDSADYFDFVFDRNAIASGLAANESELQPGSRYKVRLLLEKFGAMAIQNEKVDERPTSGTITVSPVRTCSEDRFLYHKTTLRRLYDLEYKRARQEGYEDVLFMNERGEVTEGAISSVFIEKAGRLYTPPVTCGLLPGVFRRYLLETRTGVEEKAFSLEDLQSADSIFVSNSVRGLRRVRLEPSAARTVST